MATVTIEISVPEAARRIADTLESLVSTYESDMPDARQLWFHLHYALRHAKAIRDRKHVRDVD